MLACSSPEVSRKSFGVEFNNLNKLLNRLGVADLIIIAFGVLIGALWCLPSSAQAQDEDLAMIRKYPFVVDVEHRPTGPERRQENHNYETLQGASAYASIALKKPTVHTVRISVVLRRT